MIHIDIDSETQNISLLLKMHKVTPWEYANSQTEYELKKIRLVQQHQKLLMLEAKRELQRKRQRLRQRQSELNRQAQLAETKKKMRQQPSSFKNKTVEDDGPEF